MTFFIISFHERAALTKASKTKSKPYVKGYKQYTRSDILAALEEVKKGKSALQVSKQFNIPSRTLYDRAKKMGITTIRNMKKKSFIPQPYSMGGVLSRKKEPVMTEQHLFSHLDVLDKQAFLQRTISEQCMEGIIEKDWSSFLV